MSKETKVIKQDFGFWNKDEILFLDNVEKGATITSYCCVTLLDKVKQHLVSKLRGMLSKRILFLQDSGAPHKVAIIHQKLTDLNSEFKKHLAY
jgi:hypothetical protein